MSFITDKVIEFGGPKLPGLLKLLGIIDLERYGHIDELKPNSHEGKLFVKITLKGETESTKINITYEKVVLGDKCILILKEIECTKQWVSNLVEDFYKAEQRRITLPRKVSIFF